ncbi:MAG: S9 family peptidase [Gemmatimonadaceae bacterium]|nr:S9 family peptidase [Gemmatimonadaceae bacterium]
MPTVRSSVLVLAALGAPLAPLASQPLRPMTFMDQQLMRQVGAPTLSNDGSRLLYTLSVPNWKEAKRYTDIFVVNVRDGLPSTRQLTFTKDKNENTPRWSTDGSFFVFSSNRDAANGAPTQQLYYMHPDGGEAQRITDAKDGVGAYAFSKDGKWLAFSAGKSDEQQLWLLPTAGIDTAKARPLTRHATPILSWRFSEDGRRIYFTSPDSVDKANKERMEKKFDVRIRNQDIPLNHLWVVDVASGSEKRLTSGDTFSVEGYSLSDDGKWAGVRATPNDRYARTTMEGGNHSDLYLLNLDTGGLERLTNNKGISESSLSFAPDGKTIAFSASDDFVYFRANKVYVRDIAATNGPWKKLGASYDGDVTIGWWSDDSRTIYFNDGVKATNQVLALDVAGNTVRQLTTYRAVVGAQKDDASGKIVVQYTDPRTPAIHFIVDKVDDLATKASWKQVTNANPQVANFALGEEEEICWKSVDKKETCGILVKPVGYTPGKRYPLIVAIHGGPQSADVLGFNGGYGAQAYAGDGYMVLKPNYRGSTNYGEAHKWGIVNDYFKKGYEDIITGVDKLIADGLVDGDKMGVLGWSAGGHWTNWTITHTTRFKAASSGAGTANWISMYAQSDMQDVRMHYLGNKLPYEDFEPYWKQSPIRYIKSARTPTMIHVVDGDPRVPRPQSEELHMALRQLGVPTELFVYPGSTHGIPDPRNQLLKSVAEKAWMDHWILGKGSFKWQDVLKTLEDSAPAPKAATTSSN